MSDGNHDADSCDAAEFPGLGAPMPFPRYLWAGEDPSTACPAEDEDQQPCDQPAGHKGAHSAGPHRWGMRNCNLHVDCDEREREAYAQWRSGTRPGPAVDHCHSDDCEECFGK